MLIIFKSKAAAEVTMYREHAQPVFDLWGKDSTKGILTLDELPEAIAQLEIAAHHKVTSADAMVAAANLMEKEEDSDIPKNEGVTFAARVYPLLEMLRAAQESGQEVVWGV